MQGKAEVVSDVAVPTLRPDYINVKTVAVALNPTDYKHIGFTEKPTTIGCDYAGIVEEVGSAVTAPFKKGDRIAGFAHGGNTIHGEDGAFGEYLTAKGDLQMKIPDSMSFEDAATIGVGVTTVGQALYQSLGLPMPDSPAKTKFPILIYGGSTATGALAIQYAKLSGLEVITACGSHNFDYVKSLGADAAFDYKSKTCAEDIRKHTGNKLYYAFDCISEGTSTGICLAALSTDVANKKPVLTTLIKSENTREDVDLKLTIAYTIFGEDFFFKSMEIKAQHENLEFGKKFWRLSEKLFAEGKVKTHTVELRQGGLDGIMQGLDDLKANRISGKKLVYRISDV